MRNSRVLDAARAAALDAWAVLLPIECSGCGAPDRPLCAACLTALRAEPRTSEREGLVIWSALEYTDLVGRVLVAYKDGGRADAAPALAAALRSALGAALAQLGSEPGGSGIVLVTVPSSRRAWRARGFHPVDRLLQSAGLAPAALLRPAGRVADQVGLGREQRLENRRGSLSAIGTLTGRRIVLVDDIVTTGATLLEAARAIRLAGGDVVGAVTVACTRRHQPFHLPFTGTRLTNTVTYPARTATVVSKARTNRPDQGRFARSGGRHGN
jgi:predicted amidophosphoribosyltransferase